MIVRLPFGGSHIIFTIAIKMVHVAIAVAKDALS